MKSYSLSLPLPPSSNNYWRTAVIKSKPIVHVTTEAKEYKRSVGWLVAQAGIRQPIKGRVGIVVRLFPNQPKDWERRAKKDPDGWADGVQCMDLDNCIKVTIDALKNLSFEDDAWIRKIEATRMTPDRPEGRLEITIYSISGE